MTLIPEREGKRIYVGVVKRNQEILMLCLLTFGTFEMNHFNFLWTVHQSLKSCL